MTDQSVAERDTAEEFKLHKTVGVDSKAETPVDDTYESAKEALWNPLRIPSSFRRSLSVVKGRANRVSAVTPATAAPFKPQDILAVLLLLAGIAFVFFDVHVHQWVAGVDEKLKGFARSITDIGKSHWMLIGSGVLCLGLLSVDVRQLAFRSRVGFAALYTYAAYIFFTVAASGITVVLFKWGLGRARPVLMEQVGPIFFSPLELHSRYTSFPSGHSTSIAAMSVALALIFPSYRWLILVVGFWIAFSRILVGAHYPSDVIAGITLGAAFSYYCARWMAKRRIGFRLGRSGRIVPLMHTVCFRRVLRMEKRH